MRRPKIFLAAVGAVALLAAVLWVLIAPGLLVKYPDDLDQTAVARGTATLYVNPQTGEAATSRLPLRIERNLKVIASSGSQATVQETSVERIGNQPPGRVLQRFVIDRSTVENVADRAAYAYTPDHRVDRAGTYSVNFPFRTGDGPYRFFKNETETAYPFHRAGDEVDRNGVTLAPMRGMLADVPVSPVYRAALGLPEETTLAQLAPRLDGLDPEAMAERLLPALSSADRTAVQAMLTADVPVKYVLTAQTRLLVEPATGAIVSLDRVDQTISAIPDLSRLAGLGTTLAKPEYAGDAVVQGTLAVLEQLPDTVAAPVLRLQYSQTPASVADIAAYAEDKAAEIRIVKTWVPFGLTLLGVAALIGAAVTATSRRVTV